ncbi:MAG TPA: transketolase [Bacilli bacterium]
MQTVLTLGDLKQKTTQVIENVFRMAESAGGGYVAQSLSSAEVVTALYFHAMKLDPLNVNWEGRDRLLLSVGHYAVVLYAAMMELGQMDKSLIPSYSGDGSQLEMIGCEFTPGIEITGGSLGQGLSRGIGLALAGKLAKAPWRVYVLMSDGEMQEGQTWEAAMVAAHHQLDNLTLIVDVNGVQADGYTQDVSNIEPLGDKWKAFGWDVAEINGHRFEEILPAFDRAAQVQGKPQAIISRTQMGNGVSSLMEHADVHYVKWNADMSNKALEQIKGKGGDRR